MKQRVGSAICTLGLSLGVAGFAVWMAVGTTPAFAQQTSGSISGTVTDASGAAVQGATVTLTNTDTGQDIVTLTTNESGFYTGRSLPLGNYVVKIVAQGFQTESVTKLPLHVNDALTINRKMTVGSSDQQISITADQLQLNFENATVSGLITGTQMKELVLNNRNYEQLLALQPGVSYGGTTDQLYIGLTVPGGATATASFSVSGGRSSSNNWTIDGVTNVDRGSNLTLLSYPSVDAIREFRTLRNTYTAEFGGASSGQINVVTRSGTNAFHGTVYEFFRNDVLNANTIQSKQATNPANFTPRAPLRYNDFGATLGGPIWRDKAFFFFSGEYRRVITYTGVLNTGVPTALERTGVFPSTVCTSETITNSGTASCAATGTTVANINPTAAAYLKDVYSVDGSKVPLPIATATDPTGHSLIQNQRSVYNENQEIARIDYNITKSLLLTGRMIYDEIPTVEPGGLFAGGGLPGNGTTVNESHTNAPGHNYLGRATWTATPTLVVEGGYSYSYGAILSNPTGYMSRSVSADVNPTLPYAQTLGIIPLVNLTGSTSLASSGIYNVYSTDHSFFAQATKTVRQHTLIFGGQFHRYYKSENATGSNAGTFGFTNINAPAGSPAAGTQNYLQSFANFLSGYAATYTQASQAITPALHSNMFEAFLQDNWKVMPRLTANIGVRYSFFGQPYDSNKLLDNFDPSQYSDAKAVAVDTAGNICYTTASTCAGGTTPNGAADTIVLSNGQRVYVNGIILNSGTSFGHNSPYGDRVARTHNLNVAPRLGFALDVFGNQKSVLRGGYGIAFDTTLFGTYEQNSFANPPFVQNSSYSNVRFDNPAGGTVNLANSPAPAAVRATATDFKTPYTQHWSFGLQQALPFNTVLSVDYVGEHAVHLLGIIDINQATPGQFTQSPLAINPVTSTTAACASPNQAQSCTTRNYAFTSAASELVLNRIRPYKGYNAINTVANLFGSNYNSLQAQLQKRFQHNSLLEVNYTYSKALTDNQTDRSTAVQDRTNIRAEYGRSQLDRTHILTADFVYAIPFFYNQRGFVGHTLGGWELSGVVVVNSGLPFTPSTSNMDSAGLGFLGASAAGGRPDQVGDPSKGTGLKTVAKWFNTAAFAPVPLGTIRAGNAPRGSINGPGFQRWDIGAFRNFRVFGSSDHRVDLQFRAEAFNLFNHNNPASINTTAFTNGAVVTNNTTGVVSPTPAPQLFGQVNGWRDPRIMQLAVKINY